jgi:hypothetical protein
MHLLIAKTGVPNRTCKRTFSIAKLNWEIAHVKCLFECYSWTAKSHMYTRVLDFNNWTAKSHMSMHLKAGTNLRSELPSFSHDSVEVAEGEEDALELGLL